MEIETPSGWIPLGSTLTDANGAYVLEVPTYFLGTHQWRLTTDPTQTSRVTSTTPFSLAVAPTYVPRGNAASFAELSNTHARWNPCAPVPYYVNPSGMPSNGLQVIAAALDQVRTATGITFVYSGPTHEVPFLGGAPQRASGNGITIAWSSPRRVPRLQGSVAGLSASATLTTTSPSGDVSRRYFAGGLVIDRTAHLRSRMGRGMTLGFVIMHEMGHILGLDHTSDRSQVMAPRMTRRAVSAYGAGDLAGLASVGLAQGCVA